MHLYVMTLQLCVWLFIGMIVAGPTGGGKSTCIQTLIDALSSAPKAGMSRASSGSKASSTSEKMHKLIRINPLVVDESDLMFGYLTPSNDWVDGIFTNACKKANRVSENKELLISPCSSFTGATVGQIMIISLNNSNTCISRFSEIITLSDIWNSDWQQTICQFKYYIYLMHNIITRKITIICCIKCDVVSCLLVVLSGSHWSQQMLHPHFNTIQLILSKTVNW